MKKTLVLIRHAKSSWESTTGNDYDRPLSERGKNDAPMMGQRIKAAHIVPDIIISSTANRAITTARLIANAIGYDSTKIVGKEELYHASPKVINEVLANGDYEFQTIFIVAHNPGITELVNEMSGRFYIDNMPTCAVIAAQAEVEDWRTFTQTEKEIIYYDYPKK